VADDGLVSLVDARERHLKPGGTMIPLRDTVMAALVAAPRTYADAVGAWEPSGTGLDMGPGRDAAAAAPTTLLEEIDPVVSDRVAWWRIDYATLTTPSASGRIELTVARHAVAHGCALWFDAVLSEGIGYSTAPETGDTLYGCAFLPWPQPVEVRAGARATIELRADHLDSSYVWSWNTDLAGADGVRRFRQSSFGAVPLSRERLARRRREHRPDVSGDAHVDAAALDLMCRGRTLGEVAGELRRRFPERFATDAAALGRAADLAARYAP
jgi:protein arginine N-methyltransferase 1